MKKIFTTLAAAMSALALMATTYTGQLTVTVNGASSTLENVPIEVNQNGGKYSLSINNFKLDATTGIGNIVLENLSSSTAENITMLGISRNIRITEGNEPGISTWQGPGLGDVPINMIATIAGGVLVTDIDIDMSATLQQIISVHFTSDTDKAFWKQYQMPNNDFEETTTATTEPRHWHGFESGKGSLLSSSQAAKVTTANEHRPGSAGSKCALITAGSTLGFTVNGTMSNGQLQAQSMTAESSDNHSETDPTSTAVDKNGDKYFTPLAKEPDAINFWLKYTQAQTNTSWHANFSAITYNTTANSYFQDPEHKTKSGSLFNPVWTEDENYFHNVVAKAQDRNIAAADWTEHTIDFDYDNAKWSSNNLTGDAILITISTNSKAATGKSGDKVYVDDLELIYNAAIENIALNGLSLDGFTFNKNTKSYDLTYDGEINLSANNFAITTSGRSAISTVIINDLGAGSYQVAICATSPDMLNNDLYTINIYKRTPLAEIVASGANEAFYAMKEEAKIAHLFIDEQTMEVWTLLTDGNGNWMKASIPLNIAFSLFVDENVFGATAYDAASVRGILSNINTNPLLTLTSVPTPLYGEPFNDFATHNLANALSIKPNEMAKFVGYIDNDGKLRGYNAVEWGVPGGQSLDIDNQSGVELTAGKQYSIKGIVSVKEAWSNAAPRRIATTDDNFFDNFTVAALEAEELLPTAVTDIDAASQVKSVRYYDAMGRVHNAPVDGINIVVTEMANGTTTTVKVVR